MDSKDSKKYGNLTVLRGGMDLPPDKRWKYISGFVSDTRLMGAAALELNWKVPELPYPGELHQFFYLDFNEYGIDQYIEYESPLESDARKKESYLFAILGGRKKKVTRKEAAFLLQRVSNINKKKKIPLPGTQAKYKFLLTESADMTTAEYLALMEKICEIPANAYGGVNYFLMRYFAGDGECISCLTDYQNLHDHISEFHDGDTPYITPTSDFLDKCPYLTGTEKEALLYRNDVDIEDTGKGISYVSESLIERNGEYNIVTSEIFLNPSTNHITGARECSRFRISTMEAAMKLSREEYIAVYELITDRGAFDSLFKPFVSDCTETDYDTGKLFSLYNRDNSHMNNSIYLLHNDINTFYFLTDYDQLLVTTYSQRNMAITDQLIRHSPLGNTLVSSGNFHFKDSVLFDFVSSMFEDFLEYIDYIKQ